MTSVLFDNPGPRTRRRILIGTVVAGVAVVALLVAIAVKFEREGQLESAMWAPFTDPGVQRQLLKGLYATVKVAILSIALALTLGAVLATGRLSQRWWLRVPATMVVEFFRGVPLLLLILFGFFAYGQELKFVGEWIAADPPDAFAALVIGLMLYNGSVLAEVFRAGINAVPAGQSEAAYALGLTKSRVMTLVLVPQAVRIMLPAIIAQCVVALKDSALGFIIGYQELLNAGRAIYRSPDVFGLSRSPIIQTFVVVGAVYVLLNLLLSTLARWLESRMRRSKKVADPSAVIDVGDTGEPVEALASAPGQPPRG